VVREQTIRLSVRELRCSHSSKNPRRKKMLLSGFLLKKYRVFGVSARLQDPRTLIHPVQLGEQARRACRVDAPRMSCSVYHSGATAMP
jgi:hypothetical protein